MSGPTLVARKFCRIGICMAAVAMLSWGCSSDDAEDNPGGSTSVDAVALCAEGCDLGEQACPAWTADDKTACNKTCNNAWTDLPTECRDQFDAVVACVRGGGAWDCNLRFAVGCMTDAAKLDQCVREFGTATVEAGLGPYCEKCGACFAEDASFGEGFCEPFWDAASSTFDQAKCTAEGDAWDITDRTLTASELTSMSCTDFDAAI